MKVWLQPKGYERRYRRFLVKTADELRKEILRRLETAIAAQQSLSELDNRSDEIGVLIASVAAWWQTQKPAIALTIGGLFTAISLYNDNQFRLVIKDVAKVNIPLSSRMGFNDGSLVTPSQDLLSTFGEEADIYRQEPYLDGIKNNWESSQTEYIDKVATTAIADAGLIVRNALATNAKAPITIDAINKLFDAVSKKVDRFGNDQTNNLDTQLTEFRQKSFGLTEYEWETRRDERVRGNPAGLYPNARPSHYERDRRIFSWAKPPEGGHPGQAPGCRCRARILFRK